MEPIRHRGGTTAVSPGAMLAKQPFAVLKPKGTRRMRHSRPLILASALAAAAYSLLLAGCGGHSPGVANIASSTTAATTTPRSGPVAFAHCMRSHGVPAFPDPNANGEFDGSQLKRPGVSASQVRAAQSACNYLLPNGIPVAPPYTITRADQIDYLKGAACMRRHGFPDFPDPTFQNNDVQLNVPASIDQNSPQFKSAATTCQRLIPKGLPYSGTS
jgi:hypothetical protein